MGEGNDRRTLRRNVRELPRAAWLLVAGSFVNRFASFAVVFLVLYLTRRGISPARAGLAVAVWGVGEVLASLIGGHLADRVGRRNTIVLSMFSSAATVLALSQVHSYGAILPLAFLAGLATEMYRPAGGALVADVVPEGQRVSAFALLRFAVNLAIAGGAAVAGLLANHSFFWVFLSDAGTSVAFGILALVALPEGTRTARGQDRRGGGYLHALSDRAFTIFLASSIVAAFVYFQQQAALPLHVTRVSHLSNADFGLLLSLNGILIVLFELPISSITMRLPARRMIGLGFALVGVGFGLTAFAHSLLALMVTVAIWTTGEMIGAPVGYAYVADIAPAHMRGRYQGIYGLCWSSGTVTAPVLGAYFVTRSANGFWVACGILGLFSAAFILAARQAKPPALEASIPEPVQTGPGLKP